MATILHTETSMYQHYSPRSIVKQHTTPYGTYPTTICPTKLLYARRNSTISVQNRQEQDTMRPILPFQSSELDKMIRDTKWRIQQQEDNYDVHEKMRLKLVGKQATVVRPYSTTLSSIPLSPQGSQVTSYLYIQVIRTTNQFYYVGMVWEGPNGEEQSALTNVDSLKCAVDEFKAKILEKTNVVWMNDERSQAVEKVSSNPTSRHSIVPLRSLESTLHTPLLQHDTSAPVRTNVIYGEDENVRSQVMQWGTQLQRCLFSPWIWKVSLMMILQLFSLFLMAIASMVLRSRYLATYST